MGCCQALLTWKIAAWLVFPGASNTPHRALLAENKSFASVRTRAPPFTGSNAADDTCLGATS